MRCPWCGTMMEEDETFCSECGKKVRGSLSEIGKERPVIDNSYENSSYKEGTGRNYNIGRNYSPQEPGVRKSSTGLKTGSGFSSGAVKGKAAEDRRDPRSGSRSHYSDSRPEEPRLYSRKSGDPGYPIAGSEAVDHKQGSGLGIILMAAGITAFVLLVGVGAFFLLRGNGHSDPVSKNREIKPRGKGNETDKSHRDKAEEDATTEKGEWSTVSPDYVTDDSNAVAEDKTTDDSTQPTSTTTESTREKKAETSTKPERKGESTKPQEEDKKKKIDWPDYEDKTKKKKAERKEDKKVNNDKEGQGDSNGVNGGFKPGKKDDPNKKTNPEPAPDQDPDDKEEKKYTGTVSDIEEDDEDGVTFKLHTEDETIKCYTDDEDIIDQLEEDEKISAVGIMGDDSVFRVSDVEVKEKPKKKYTGTVSDIEEDDEDGVTFKLHTEDETIKCYTDDEDIIDELEEDDKISVTGTMNDDSVLEISEAEIIEKAEPADEPEEDDQSQEEEESEEGDESEEEEGSEENEDSE